MCCCCCCWWPIFRYPIIFYSIAAGVTLRFPDIPTTDGLVFIFAIRMRRTRGCWCRISLFTWISCCIRMSRPIFMMMVMMMIVGPIRIAFRWATTTTSSLEIGRRTMVITLWYEMIIGWPGARPCSTITVVVPSWRITTVSGARWFGSSMKEKNVI